MIKGAGFAYIWKETAILAGMTLLLMVISSRRFKTRLEEEGK
jgi:ABC-2 type transport system permease protein